ncbi:hypothetical protein A2917_02305 [Candidatus Nomurabacteria bacterium RIFCSPLOWO2_01_FULL_42_17]|uniref:Uncharacterized protein n=1 Tax=Candidatus Nomurabacteria bacterium RIFCSPLOWO2_01_FULL_42_17 TaxID=1801780 RepID=A0A1F6XMM2_9BACT|nr:MAG: hypothetical protein A2917_02305 [Candidatus Nomurabacteria bacterium RIFCSPLOWO2_01_FULL_42_17]
MDAIIESQIFFFISSVGFVVLGIMAFIFLFYLIRATNVLSEIMRKVEKDIDSIGDTTKEMLEEVRHSVIFNFLFRRKKKHRKN